MYLFVGLGNPGAEHADNRHNIGFMAIDRIAEHYAFPPFKKKFHGQYAEGHIGGKKILLLKPQTYVNESGQAVAEAMRFYKLPLSRLVIFYDEMDLPPGKLRMRTGGGLAGHNGLRSLKAHIGNEFRRARLGIGHPGHKDKVLQHVLKNFNKDEKKWLEPFLDALAEHAGLLAEDNDAAYQNKVHLAMQALTENPPTQKPEQRQAQAQGQGQKQGQKQGQGQAQADKMHSDNNKEKEQS